MRRDRALYGGLTTVSRRVLVRLFAAVAADEARHGLSAFGELGPDFQHFDYVNRTRQRVAAWRIGRPQPSPSTVSTHSFCAGMLPRADLFDSLMVRAMDSRTRFTASSPNGQTCTDRRSVTFQLPRGHFDGSPVTAAMSSSPSSSKDKGRPHYQILASSSCRGPRATWCAVFRGKSARL